MNGKPISGLREKFKRSGLSRWPMLAAGLSYYSAISVAPLLAICFIVARGFDLEEALTRALSTSFAGQEATLGPLQEFAENMIVNFSGSLLVFGALAFIFWSGYRLLDQLERIFSRIYGYHPPRRTLHRAVDYFVILLIVPLMLVASGAINVYLTGLSRADWSLPAGIGLDLAPLIKIFIFITPYLLWWMVLSWAYSYFSRGLIGWPERLLGGLLAALLFHLFQIFYLQVIFALTSYNPIYGSFAAVPLFLIWVYSSWLIIMLGGETSRRLADRRTAGLPFFLLAENLDWRGTRELARQILETISRNYQSGESGAQVTSMRELSRITLAPLPHLGRVVNRLLAADLIYRVSGPAPNGLKGPFFLPARCPDEDLDEVVEQALERTPLTL